MCALDLYVPGHPPRHADVARAVLSFLPHTDLCHAAAVSSSFRSVSECPRLWRALCEADFGDAAPAPSAAPPDNPKRMYQLRWEGRRRRMEQQHRDRVGVRLCVPMYLCVCVCLRVCLWVVCRIELCVLLSVCLPVDVVCCVM